MTGSMHYVSKILPFGQAAGDCCLLQIKRGSCRKYFVRKQKKAEIACIVKGYAGQYMVRVENRMPKVREIF